MRRIFLQLKSIIPVALITPFILFMIYINFDIKYITKNLDTTKKSNNLENLNIQKVNVNTKYEIQTKNYNQSCQPQRKIVFMKTHKTASRY